MSQIQPAIASLGKNATSQTSQGLIVQGYCTTILQQPELDLSFQSADKEGKRMKEIGDNINEGLRKAKSAATSYLQNTQPGIIRNLTNIDRFANLHSSIPTVLPDGASEAEWLQILQALETQAASHQREAESVATELTKLHGTLSEVASELNGASGDLNALVKGDEGVLARLQEELDSIHGKIAGAITGIAVSGLVLVGGALVTAVGAISTFLTAGTSSWVVAGGVALILVGAGGVVGSSIALAGLLEEESNLIHRKTNLEAQVKLAESLNGNVQKITNQTNDAAKASLQMSAAWNLLGGNLGSLSKDLKDGRLSPGRLRELFLTTANKDMADVKSSVTTIKAQMTGVSTEIAPKGGTVVQLTKDIIARKAA